MHADSAEVKKSVRSYMMVFGSLMVLTVITVAIAEVQLAVPLAVTLALIVASVKASLVASVFMHLKHERMWIYGSLLLTVAFFVVLMLIPVFTTIDTYGEHTAPPPTTPAAEHSGH